MPLAHQQFIKKEELSEGDSIILTMSMKYDDGIYNGILGFYLTTILYYILQQMFTYNDDYIKKQKGNKIQQWNGCHRLPPNGDTSVQSVYRRE